MHRIIIIEDEQLAATRLRNMILEVLPDAEIVQHFTTVKDSIIYFMKNNDYDLIFMDIQLSDGNSFDILNNIDINKPTIFTSAYDQYALPAFKHFVIDYLLKPIRISELKAAIQKYLDKFQPIAVTPFSSKNWTIKIGNQIKIIPHKDILYYYAQEKINYAVLNDGRKYAIDLSIEHIFFELDPKIYFRINRQYIVRQDAITKIISHTKSRFRLTIQHCKDFPVVSTERSQAFMKWLKTDSNEAR